MKKVFIQENIRRMRKEMKLTQEQLAEALGVTIGAVSKWENGLSYPDLHMIVEIADFFEVSVDVLLGTDVNRSTAEELTERIRGLLTEERFEEGCAEAEKALQKYPHCFLLLYECARLYEIKGVVSKGGTDLARARELYERAIDFITENRDEKLSELSIRRGIATTYELEGETEKALDVLQRCNYDGVNDTHIGTLLVRNEKSADRGLDYLSGALLYHVIDLYRITIGFLNAFYQKKRIKESLEMMQWMHGVFKGIREKENEVCYIDRLDAVLLAQIAYFEMLEGNDGKMKKALIQSVTLARRYDLTPVYDLRNMKYVQYYSGMKDVSAHDSLGTGCLKGIDLMLREAADNEKSTYRRERSRFLKIWDDLCGL